jgi:hypothetical protein
LCLIQQRSGTGGAQPLQTIDIGRVVPVHPIAQRLPVHAIQFSRFRARAAFQNHREREQTANLGTIRAFTGETPKLRCCHI